MTRDDNESPSTPKSTSDNSTHEEPLLSLPPSLRDALKDPFGPIETDADNLLERSSPPIITVGDVVTYHVTRAGRPPDVAVVDGYTERQEVAAEIRETVTEPAHGRTLEVTNPPAVLTEALVRALCEALECEDPTTILVDGEEDLATLPAIVAAPTGASVVYGQPGEGMVLVTVTDELRAEVRGLLERFDGESEWLWELLESPAAGNDESPPRRD